MSKNFCVQSILVSWKILVPKNFRSKKILSPKKIWVMKILGHEKQLGVQNNFGCQKVFGPETFWIPLLTIFPFPTPSKYPPYTPIHTEHFSSVRIWLQYLRPSSQLPDTFYTACRHLQDTFKTHSIHFRTPPRHIPDNWKWLLDFYFAGWWVSNWSLEWSGRVWFFQYHFVA